MGAVIPHNGIQWHISASGKLSYKMLISHTAFQLLSITKQNIIGYLLEGSNSTLIPATSAYVVIGQHKGCDGKIVATFLFKFHACALLVMLTEQYSRFNGVPPMRKRAP